MNKLTQLEFSDKDMETAAKIARRLGFGDNTAYTSSSALVGLFCLPDRHSQKKGCIIKTAELGFLFVADLEDLLLNDIKTELENS